MGPWYAVASLIGALGGITSVLIVTVRDRRVTHSQAGLNESQARQADVEAITAMLEQYRTDNQGLRDLMLDLQIEFNRLKRWKDDVMEWIRGLPPEIRATAPSDVSTREEPLDAE